MSKIKFIKTESDYKEALELIKVLLSHDPDPSSDEGEQLSLLSALIQDYESRSVPESLPSPIDAIKFRMEQMDLKPADLVPYIGSRSRVSEILSGKRSLTLDMVRSLEAGLGIPAKILIRKPEMEDNSEYQGWDNSLVAEMESRGYFGDKSTNEYSKLDLLKDFFSSINAQPQLAMMLRKSSYRSSPLTDKRALVAWSNRVMQKAKQVKITKKYKEGTIDLNFMQEFIKLSSKEDGVLLAQKHLKDVGIILVVEPHFQKTYLDGAAILVNKVNPIIGLTLRYDRLDNFWFTLMHELSHISLHYNQDVSLYYDELDNNQVGIDEKEKEADALAEESILPKAKWEVSPARLIPSSMAANSLAKELDVHVAVIAGQIRHKGNKYIYLNKVINGAKVRDNFTNEKWNK
ncbi:MAG: ImmA/IrrE family metallo-endopeptidase [Patescibacteria group bacterium]